jgi:hypothetical protein
LGRNGTVGWLLSAGTEIHGADASEARLLRNEVCGHVNLLY